MYKPGPHDCPQEEFTLIDEFTMISEDDLLLSLQFNQKYFRFIHPHSVFYFENKPYRALVYCLLRGYLNVFTFLLSQGIQLETTDIEALSNLDLQCCIYGTNKEHETALFLAVKYRYSGLVRVLLAQGVNSRFSPDQRNHILCAFKLAISQNNSEIVGIFLSTVPWKESTICQEIEFTITQTNSFEILLILLQRIKIIPAELLTVIKKNIARFGRYKNTGGQTALVLSVRYGMYEIVDLLLKTNVSMDDCDRVTAIKYAILNNKIEIFFRLYQSFPSHLQSILFEKYKAKLLDYNFLLHAVFLDNVAEIVSYIFKNIPTVNYDDLIEYVLTKTTSINSLIFFLHDETIRNLVLSEKNRNLLNSTIHKFIGLKNVNHETLLTVAARNGWKPLVETLLDHGADMESLDSHDLNVLMTSIMAGHLEIAVLLLERRARIYFGDTEKDMERATAVSIAAGAGQTTILRFLFTHHREQSQKVIDWQRESGYSPLMLAAQNGYFEIVKILLSEGANKDIARSVQSKKREDKWGD